MGGEVLVLAIGIIGHGTHDRVCEYAVVTPDFRTGDCSVGRVLNLADTDDRGWVAKQFPAGGWSDDARVAAVSHALEGAGYGRLENEEV